MIPTRFLRSIYRPHNVYCVHVDVKSSVTFKQAVASIVDCFENVFVTDKLESVVYAGFTRLKAEINCMRDILDDAKYPSKKLNPAWKYLLNMASSEFPLKTNYEMTRVLHMYNGTNEIEILKNINRHRIEVSWKLHDGHLRPSNNSKSKAPHGYRVVKGLAYCVMSRAFVEHALTSQRAKDLLAWAEDTFSPDEWYWATLQFNTQFGPPGGFKGNL